MLFDVPRRIETYEFEIDDGLRIRTHIERQHGELCHFAVTLECEVSGSDWRAVVRYDTTGGEVHRDRLKPDGSHLTHRESVKLGSTLHDSLSYARRDLMERYEWYVREFHQMLS